MNNSRAVRACMAGLMMSGLCLTMAAPAMAAPTPAVGGAFVQQAGPDNPINPALINANAKTTLTIHKYLNNGSPAVSMPSRVADVSMPSRVADVGTSSDGTVQPDPGYPTLEGVEFDVYQVFTNEARTAPVNLTTNEGWATAAGLNQQTISRAQAESGSFVHDGVTYYLGAATEVKTNEDGEAVFEGGVGFYLVVESIESGDTIVNTESGETVPASSVTPAAPFFVTLPMTNPDDRTEWMYSVHVYPKNTSDFIRKEVVDEGTVAGTDGQDAMSYVLYSSITPNLTGDQMGTYVIGDDLHELVTLTGVTVEIEGEDAALTAGTHYTVYVNDEAWDGTSAVDPGAKVEIVMTDAGLTRLAAAKADNFGTMVRTTLDVTVDPEADGDTTVPNDAMLVPSNPWWESQPGVSGPYDPEDDDPNNPDESEDPVTPPTSDEVVSLFGSLDLTKVDANDNAVNLEGAVFSIYHADDANSCDTLAADDLIAEGLTTDADGNIVFNGLQASLFRDGAAATDPNGYCIVETEAPEGYNLLAEPIYFEIAYTDNGDGTFAVETEDMTIENAPDNLGNDLPITGGVGAAGLGAGAFLLLGAAAVYGAKRRQANKATDTGSAA